MARRRIGRPRTRQSRRVAAKRRCRPSHDEAKRLLGGFLDHLLENGLASSLRPAAASMGTSARMLLHYFGSKDGLLAAAMQEFATRQRQLVLEELTRHPVRDPHHHVMAFWRSFASKEREPFLLLLLEMWVAALRDPKRLGVFFEATRGYFDLTVQMLTESGLPRAQATVSATVYLAALRGLMLDLLATGDRTRIGAAAARIAALIDADVAANQQANADGPPSRA